MKLFAAHSVCIPAGEAQVFPQSVVPYSVTNRLNVIRTIAVLAPPVGKEDVDARIG